MLSGYKWRVDKCFSSLDQYLDEIVDERRLGAQDGEEDIEEEEFLDSLL